MCFIKYFLFLSLACFSIGVFAQTPKTPPALHGQDKSPTPQLIQPEMSPDSLLKQYGDSARIKMMAKDYEGAYHYADLRIKKTPFRLQFMYYDRAEAETYLGKNENAIRDYDTVIGLDSSAGAAYMNQAYLYMQVHKTNKAMHDYEKALQNAKDSELFAAIYMSRGNAYLSMKETKNAEADFTKALLYNPNSWQSSLQRGSIRRFAKDYSGSLSDLNRAYKLKPTDPDVLLLRGMVLFESGMYKETIVDLKEAMKYRRNNSDTWYYMGMSEMNLGQDSLAKEYFTKILEVDPKNVLVLNTRGKVNFDMKHPLLAIKDYTKVIQLKPQSAEAYANRAYVYTQIGEKDKACTDWHKAASLGMKKANEIIKKYCGQ